MRPAPGHDDGRKRWTDGHSGYGFMLANGVFGVVAGVVLLTTDARIARGRACLIIGCGLVLLAAAFLVAFDIDVVATRKTYVWAGVVVLFAAAMSLYLTHPAEDLPRLLPGHDADSPHLRMFNGVVSAFIAYLALRFAYGSASIRRGGSRR